MTQNLAKDKMTCEIIFDSVSLEAWHEKFQSVKRSNLLQSVDYGFALSKINHQKVRHGLITLNGVDAGLFQIMEASLFGRAIHAVILDRGPLWFDGFGSSEDFSAFLDRFSKMFPKRIGRKIRFIPEIEGNADIESLLKQHRFQQKGHNGYQTLWLDLDVSEEAMRARLKKKWRGSLKKAEDAHLDVLWSDTGENFAWLMKHYITDKKDKNYDGVSPQTLITLADRFSRGKRMVIGTALLDGAPIASILVFIHGNCATYQIGYSSDTGRKLCAHHLLLFRVQGVLKERGIHGFDLGGINEQDAKGVGMFKKGMGGQRLTLPGLYCR